MKQTDDYVIIPITREWIEHHRKLTLGLSEILERFDKTGCYSSENPNQNQSWCSCRKPFCYDCVAWQIILKYRENGEVIKESE